MKWIISILMVLCMLTIVTATEDSILTFQTDQNVTLSTLCYATNGTTCKVTSNCNVTTFFPNGSINYTEKVMTFNGTGFFKVDLGRTNLTGDYRAVTYCSMGTYTGVGRADYRVSDDTKGNILGGFNMIGVVLIPLVLSILMIIGSAILDNEHKGLKFMLFVGSFVPIFMAIYSAINSTTNTTLKEALSENAQWATWIFIVIVAYALLYLVYVAVTSVKAGKNEKYKY